MPRDGTATKQRILEAAERLVIDNGFAATSVDEVIAASKTSKGAFFHHFGSKLDLARALVARYAAADIEQLNRAVAEAQATTDDPAERVIAFVRVFERAADELMSAQSGCLFVSLLTERQLVQSATSAHIREAIVAWRADFSAILHEAVHQHRRLERVDIDALADHLFVTFEGPRFACATGLLAEIDSDLPFASCEARRAVGRRLRSLISLTPQLFRVCEHAQPVGAGPIRGPALMPREVCCPRTRAPSLSPISRRGAGWAVRPEGPISSELRVGTNSGATLVPTMRPQRRLPIA